MNLPRAWNWPVALGMLLGTGILALGNVTLAQQATPLPRKLAPGVMKKIAPDPKSEESVSRHDLVEVLALDPKLDWAKNIAFRHDVWALHFEFKPMRMLSVDIPQPNGYMRRQLVWYMVYSVTNSGKVLHPVQTADKKFEIRQEERPIRFIPEFLLEARESVSRAGEIAKVYRDRVIPLAAAAISRREDPAVKFHNSVEMCRSIRPGETVWGVATWENVNPRVDRFSVYVQGLTNAYRWQDRTGPRKPGEKIIDGHRISRKTLRLNFWRPGDEYEENEREIRYGIPGELDYEWVYR